MQKASRINKEQNITVARAETFFGIFVPKSSESKMPINTYGTPLNSPFRHVIKISMYHSLKDAMVGILVITLVTTKKGSNHK